MSNSVTVPMSTLCSIKSGKSDTKDAVENGEFAFFDRSKVIKRSSRYLYDCEALIVAGEGAEFLPKHYIGKFDLHQRAYAIHAFNEKINVKYLFYYLHYLKDYLPSVAVGATVKSLRLRHFENLPVILFPVSTQQKIVEKLDAIFAEIDRATVATETNIKNAEALFQSYLTEVFEHGSDKWEIKRVNDIADLIDSLHKTPKYADEGYPMVRVTDVKVGELNLSKTKKVDEKTFNEFSKRHTPKIGDIVFSRVGSYGVSAIVSTNEKFCLGQNTVFIIPKINPVFLYYFLNSGYAKKQYDELKDGVTQPTISLKSIKSVVIPLPQETEIQKLILKFEEMYKHTKVLKQEFINKREQLEYLKQSTLYKAFNGELVEE